MTVDSQFAVARQDQSAVRCRSRIVERAGYLTDEAVFDLVRDGIAHALTRRAMAAPVYICHSLGCFVGLDAASREPGAIVIAINMPASPWHGFRRAAVTLVRMTQIASRQGVAKASQFRDNWVYFGSQNVDDLSRHRLKRIHRPTQSYAMPRRQDNALFLKTVMLEHRSRGPHTPRVLLIQGGRDPIAPLQDVNALRRRVPDASLVTLDGGHVLPVTHPHEVVGAVERFLQAN